ncbi:MAG: hypothetical protein WCB51_12185 [Candidatus Dormiibacterota bacterium]
METWELWFPAAAANGLLFARSRIEEARAVWVHSPPDVLSVVVRDGEAGILSIAPELRREGPHFPMARLQRDGRSIAREDRWPTHSDLGELVILPGGEAGELKRWWNAEDGSEWRWELEFYNHV